MVPGGHHHEDDVNYYDKLVVDVNRLYEDYPVTEKTPGASVSTIYRRLVYGNKLLPLSLRESLYRLFHRTDLDIAWFMDFRKYWSQVLGGRPLWVVDDLHFLCSHYRIRFQNLQGPDTDSAQTHLAAWQQPGTLYLLLHYVRKQTLHTQLPVLNATRWLGRRPKAFLEFGCSLAPLTWLYFTFVDPLRRTTAYIADIETLPFHYGAFRLRTYPNVIPIPLKVEDDLLLGLDARVDVIFCIEVYEHLNHPLKTTQIFHELLNPGGLLIFDYICSHGRGLDSVQGVSERSDVLDFIQQHFTIRQGAIDRDNSMGLTVAQKR